MEVVIVPKAHMMTATAQPWHEVIRAAQQGEHGMRAISQYEHPHFNKATQQVEVVTATVERGVFGSPLCRQADACPVEHAMLYDRKGSTYLHFQNW